MKKLIPLALMVVLFALPASPAIGVDTSSNSGVKGAIAADWTWSHTCTGSNLVLYVAIVSRDATLNNRTVSAVTYNGVSMTSINSRDEAANIVQASLWRLIAPATGAHTISVTMTAYATNVAYGTAVSFTGVDQTTPEDTANNGGTGTATSIGSSTPVTLVTTNAWIVGIVGMQGNSGTITQVGDIGTQTGTQVFTNQNTGPSLTLSGSLSYNGPGSAASHYVSWSQVNSQGFAQTKIGIRPASAPSTIRHRVVIR